MLRIRLVMFNLNILIQRLKQVFVNCYELSFKLKQKLSQKFKLKLKLSYYLRRTVNLNTLYIIFILIWTKDLGSGDSYKKHILWNTGYSQFQTQVTDHYCLHLDPGGTIYFPVQLIYKLCNNKKNIYFALHNDRYHTNFIHLLKKIDQNLIELKIDEYGMSNSLKIKTLPDAKDPKLVFIFKISKNHILISTGHLEKDNLTDFLNLNLASDLSSETTQSLILSNHGQPKFLTKEKVLHLSKFKMLISGSQSRKYKNHPSTETKFLKINSPLILKNKWGHLIFE